ncbi:hypothetical protein J1N35_011613 [Gossypium stocksii]|uniref:Reverse transcriptase zinc-binding domain-containing protein n=1 Tax=Gossypium stocksii TaxID=47602 RepID=A0A9D3W4U2_9ROSI|nr:hypothetical protein J1N35_011613 [Gossypium stocksii]
MAESINPILGINLEGELRAVFGQVDMEHDSEEQYLEEGEGEKRLSKEGDPRGVFGADDVGKEVMEGDEPSGDFFVRRAYKLLQNGYPTPTLNELQTEDKDFYKKLWSSELLAKIKITIWRILNNYIPTFSNLYYKQLVSNLLCPRCSIDVDSVDHIFRGYPVSKEVLGLLGFHDIISVTDQDFFEWLTRVFNDYSVTRRQVPCVAL